VRVSSESSLMIKSLSLTLVRTYSLSLYTLVVVSKVLSSAFKIAVTILNPGISIMRLNTLGFFIVT